MLDARHINSGIIKSMSNVIELYPSNGTRKVPEPPSTIQGLQQELAWTKAELASATARLQMLSRLADVDATLHPSMASL